MKGDLTIKPDRDRDEILERMAEHFGARSLPAFLGVILAQIARVPHPRYLFRVLGAMEAEIDRIEAEEGRGRK